MTIHALVKMVLPRLNGLDLSHNEKWTNQVTKDLVQRLRLKYPGLTLKVYKEHGIFLDENEKYVKIKLF